MWVYSGLVMAKTLQDVIAESTKASQSEASPVSLSGSPADRPFWVVVVNPRRQPPEPKFHSSYTSEQEAETAKNVLQLGADNQALQETNARRMMGLPAFEPYQFHVIARPEGGQL